MNAAAVTSLQVRDDDAAGGEVLVPAAPPQFPLSAPSRLSRSNLKACVAPCQVPSHHHQHHSPKQPPVSSSLTAPPAPRVDSVVRVSAPVGVMGGQHDGGLNSAAIASSTSRAPATCSQARESPNRKHLTGLRAGRRHQHDGRNGRNPLKRSLPETCVGGPTSSVPDTRHGERVGQTSIVTCGSELPSQAGARASAGSSPASRRRVDPASPSAGPPTAMPSASMPSASMPSVSASALAFAFAPASHAVAPAPIPAYHDVSKAGASGIASRSGYAASLKLLHPVPPESENFQVPGPGVMQTSAAAPLASAQSSPPRHDSGHPAQAGHSLAPDTPRRLGARVSQLKLLSPPPHSQETVAHAHLACPSMSPSFSRLGPSLSATTLDGCDTQPPSRITSAASVPVSAVLAGSMMDSTYRDLHASTVPTSPESPVRPYLCAGPVAAVLPAAPPSAGFRAWSSMPFSGTSQLSDLPRPPAFPSFNGPCASALARYSLSAGSFLFGANPPGRRQTSLAHRPLSTSTMAAAIPSSVFPGASSAAPAGPPSSLRVDAGRRPLHAGDETSSKASSRLPTPLPTAPSTPVKARATVSSGMATAATQFGSSQCNPTGHVVTAAAAAPAAAPVRRADASVASQTRMAPPAASPATAAAPSILRPGSKSSLAAGHVSAAALPQTAPGSLHRNRVDHQAIGARVAPFERDQRHLRIGFDGVAGVEQPREVVESPHASALSKSESLVESAKAGSPGIADTDDVLGDATTDTSGFTTPPELTESSPRKLGSKASDGVRGMDSSKSSQSAVDSDGSGAPSLADMNSGQTADTNVDANARRSSDRCDGKSELDATAEAAAALTALASSASLSAAT